MKTTQLLASTALVAIATSGLAQTSVSIPVGANTETAQGVPGSFDDIGFSISIDDTPIAGAAPFSVPDRLADIRTDRADIQVRYDGLYTTRLLNVRTDEMRTAYRAGEAVTFRTSMNYPAYVQRSEVRILDRSGRGSSLVTTLAVGANDTATWTMPSDGSGEYAYVLRTYDAAGRYDETQPLALMRTTQVATDALPPFVAAGEGEDNTAIRRIPVSGGTVTVSGGNARPGSTIRVNGEPVPVDARGRFVTSRILPAGDRVVTVDIDGQRYRRDVSIPTSEWFHVGLIDITAGWRNDESIDDTDTYVDGRFALYAKGRTQSGWQITGSVDTGYGPIDEAFSRLNEKDPRSVLARLQDNDDDLYPTYGDDSTSFDDTPSQGRVYLRVENETTRLTWGDFKAGVNSGGLIANTRDLYGAELRFQSPSVTGQGDPRFAAQVYAASPDTAAQRDILRGTGGSIYFLQRQDISGGTVDVTVQSVDPVTGRVVASRTLSEGSDYRVDYLQGVLILSAPLGSTTSDGGLVSDGSAAFDQNLVVQYEYSPPAGISDAMAIGGRVEAWATDRLRFGATLIDESQDVDELRMAGVDLRYQLSAQSYAEIEFAQSEGTGLARSTSTDGGLTIIGSGGTTADATALRFDSRFDFGDLGLAMPGYVGVYAEQKEAGFATLYEDITDDQTLVGIQGEVTISDRLSFSGMAERFDSDSGEEKTSAEVNVLYDINDTWAIGLGIETLDQTVPGDATRTGSRTDAAVRLTYRGFEDTEVYVFGQSTLEVSGGLSDNDRLGAGFTTALNERLSASGEFSDGDTGQAGAFRLNYAPSSEKSYYLGYDLAAIDPDTGVAPVAENGTIVAGARTQNSSNLSSFIETKSDLPAPVQSITNAFGVTYTPSAQWAIGGSIETGTVRDEVNGDFDRDAISVGFTFAEEDLRTANLRLEYRTEDGDGVAQDRDTWGLVGGYTTKVNENWRFIAGLDALYSDSAEDDFRNGEYTRLRLGYAYRPIENERLNLLFSYEYLNDLPGEDQIDANGNVDGPQQRSHVLSVNGSYDLTQQLTFGGKLGYRSSEVADRGTDVFTSDTATLGVARLDWHAVHEWDVLAEGRVLLGEETGTDETSALLGVYRHVGDNAKIGVGYQWGAVSDDLTDLNYTSQGLFVNLIAKF